VHASKERARDLDWLFIGFFFPSFRRRSDEPPTRPRADRSAAGLLSGLKPCGPAGAGAAPVLLALADEAMAPVDERQPHRTGDLICAMKFGAQTVAGQRLFVAKVAKFS